MSGTHELGVLVVHGMGTPDHDIEPDGTMTPTFHVPMMKEINRRVRGLGGEPEKIAWEPVLWHSVIADKQDDLLDAMRNEGTQWNAGRRFALASLGDASAYTYNAGAPNSIYRKIHETVSQSIKALRDRLIDLDRPLVIMAHSLGGIISSDYIWDRGKLDGTTDPLASNDFERLHTLTSIITFGCNIPLFVHGFDPIRAITFPHPDLPDHLKQNARWFNYYDKDDVLGYPLAPLCDDYARLQERGWLNDISMNSGPIWSSWSPLSHNHYWTDNDFTRPVARTLLDLMT